MFDPFGESNAREIQNAHARVFQPLTLPHLRKVAEALVRGPEIILLTRDTDDLECAFERMFRTVVLVPNRRLESWAVFRRELEWDAEPEDDAGCILRHSTWDTKADLTAQSWQQGEGPTVRTTTWYIAASRCASLRAGFRDLDTIVAAGVSFEFRPQQDQVEWEELALSRAFKWGQVDLEWDFSRRNRSCEAAVFALAQAIEDVLAQAKSLPVTVARMRLTYPLKPYLTLS